MSNEKKKNQKKEKSSESKPEIRYVPLDIRTMEEDDDELDFVEVFRKFWEGRKTIFRTVLIFILLGLTVAILSTVEYTSQVKLLPETQQSTSLGSLGGLAQQFGFSAGSQPITEGIPSIIYPDIIQSNAFLQELMEYEVTLPGSSQRVTLEEYIEDYQESSILGFLIRAPFKIKAWLIGDDEEELTLLDRTIADQEKLNRLIRMPKEDWNTLRKIRNRITTTQNSETGVVTISVEMRDPVITAEVADQVVQMLSEYITENRTEKARQDLEFIEKQFENAKTRFEEAQRELAAFNDANRGQLTAMARTEEQLLQSRYNLNFNLYNSMAERLEEARINLQEETPVVNILEPAAVPDKRSEPNRILILIAFTIIGVIIGVAIIFIKPFWKKIESEVHS